MTLFLSYQVRIKRSKTHAMAANESPYPIQGILVPPGQPLPLRRNFNDWSTNYEQSISVSLFIRALQQWYSMDYDKMLSYFRIAGKLARIIWCRQR